MISLAPVAGVVIGTATAVFGLSRDWSVVKVALVACALTIVAVTVLLLTGVIS